MKQKDIMTIAVVGVFAAVFSLIVASMLLSSPKKRNLTAPVAQPISSNFARPSEDQKYQKFFNKNAINPTQLIQIGDNSNANPFGAPAR